MTDVCCDSACQRYCNYVIVHLHHADSTTDRQSNSMVDGCICVCWCHWLRHPNGLVSDCTGRVHTLGADAVGDVAQSIIDAIQLEAVQVEVGVEVDVDVVQLGVEVVQSAHLREHIGERARPMSQIAWLLLGPR